MTRGRSSLNIAKERIDCDPEQDMVEKHMIILLPHTLQETNRAIPSYRLGRESTLIYVSNGGLRSQGQAHRLSGTNTRTTAPGRPGKALTPARRPH